MARRTALQTRTAAPAQQNFTKQKSSHPAGAAAETTVAASSADQIVTLRQSTDVMQTLFHSAVSAVTYIRGIFPTSCFDLQTYKTISDEYTYADFVKDTGKSKETGGNQIFVLKPGRSSRADKFLNWLVST
jgi:hypothetical protein